MKPTRRLVVWVAAGWAVFALPAAWSGEWAALRMLTAAALLCLAPALAAVRLRGRLAALPPAGPVAGVLAGFALRLATVLTGGVLLTDPAAPKAALLGWWLGLLGFYLLTLTADAWPDPDAGPAAPGPAATGTALTNGPE
jgi:hypothetical protein